MRLVSTFIAAMAAASAAYADPTIEAATLPDARSVGVGQIATYFGVIANSGDSEATNCRIEKAPGDTSPTTLSYQTVTPANVLSGSANTPVNIPAGATQNFVIGLEASGAFAGDIVLNFVCDNATALGRPNVNTVFLTSETGTPADLITIMITPSGDGVIRVGSVGGVSVAAGSVTNIEGGNANVRATPRLIGLEGTLGHTLTICETDPGTGVCLAPRSETVDMTVGSAASTFSVFLDASDEAGIQLLPSFVRVSVDFNRRFTTRLGALRGRSSVAATAPGPLADRDDVPMAGVYQISFHDEINDPTGEDITSARFAVLEDGTGHGTFLRTDLFPPALQAFRVEGVSNTNRAGGGIYTADLTLLEDVRFNDLGTTQARLTLRYTTLSGFFGSYSFNSGQVDADPIANTDRTSSRIRARGSVDQLGLECSLIRIAGQYDIYFGDEPFQGREPDATATLSSQTPTTNRVFETAVVVTGDDPQLTSFEGTFFQPTGSFLETFGFQEPIRFGTGTVRIGGNEMTGVTGTLVGCSAEGFTVVLSDSDDQSVIVHFRRRVRQ